jgi:hypothetical protein
VATPQGTPPCARGDGRSVTGLSRHDVPSPSGMCPPTRGAPLRSRRWWRRTCLPQSQHNFRRTNAMRAKRAVVRGICCQV